MHAASSRPGAHSTLDFLRLLWGIENCLQSASKRMATTLGITGPQRVALRLVARAPGISPKELAELMHLHPSTVTGIVHRLVEKGLLTRDAHETDGRRAHLRVRPASQRFTRNATATVEAAVARVLQRMPKTSVRHAREVLLALIDELNADIARWSVDGN